MRSLQYGIRPFNNRNDSNIFRLYRSKKTIEAENVLSVRNMEVKPKFKMEMIPNPKDYSFAFEGTTQEGCNPNKISYDPSKEAKFDPRLHLDLEMPKSISIFDGNGFRTVSRDVF